MSTKRRHRYLVLLALISLVVAATACSTSGDDTEDQVATVEPTDRPTPTNTPTLMPTEMPTNEPVPLTDLKQELYFGGGGGGWPGCSAWVPAPETNLPAISIEVFGYNKGHLCLYGFSLDEEITVELYAPAGHHVSSGVFQVMNLEDDFDADDCGDVVQTYPAPERDNWEQTNCGIMDGVTFIDAGMLWFPVGVPAGEWRGVAHSPSAQATGRFTVDFSGLPKISTVPDSDINPFIMDALRDRIWDIYRTDEQVRILGTNFPPNENLRFAIYHVMADEGTSVRSVLVYDEMVATDGQGNLQTSFRIEQHFPCGEYYAMVLTGNHEYVCFDRCDFSGASDPFQIVCPSSVTATPFADTPVSSDCSDDSQFIADVTIPDNTKVAPGQAFTKVWQVKNNGSCTWTMDYQLVFVEGEPMGAPGNVQLTQDVPPGATYDVAVTFTAPATPDAYRSRWQLRAPDDALFGARPYVQIIVP